MAQTLTNLVTHFVFSTKHREPLIGSELMPELHRYLGGVVKAEGGIALAVGGVEDHVHMLLKLPPTLAASDLMRVVKASSSKWVNEERARGFRWQAGFAGFSVSQSNIEQVRGYIARQEQHHRKVTFQEELRALLEKHEVEYDERYVWE